MQEAIHNTYIQTMLIDRRPDFTEHHHHHHHHPTPLQDTLAAATQVAEEGIGNVRTVRAFGSEAREVQRYQATAEVGVVISV